MIDIRDHGGIFVGKGGGGGGGGGMKVKSVQRGRTGSFENSLDVSISSINPEKSIILIDGAILHPGTSTAGGYAGDFFVRGEITGPNGIKLVKDIPFSQGGKRINALWTVVEFEEGVTIQSGVFQPGSIYSEDDVNISPINVDKSFLIFHRGNGSTSGYGVVSSSGYMFISSSTTLTARVLDDRSKISYFVIETE